MSAKKSASIIRNVVRIIPLHFSAFSFSPHLMSLNSDVKKILPSNCSGSHFFLLNLFEEAQCWESWEYFHSNSIDCPIQMFQMITLEIPLNFFLPSLVRVLFLYLPDRAPSRRRRRSWHSRSDEFCHTASLSRSLCSLHNQPLIRQRSVWFLINFSVSLNKFFKGLTKMSCCSKSGIHKHSQIAAFTLRSSISFVGPRS